MCWNKKIYSFLEKLKNLNEKKSGTNKIKFRTIFE